MVTIIFMIKLFHLFISALCAAVFLDSVNPSETFPVSLSLFTLHLNTHGHRSSGCGQRVSLFS